MATIRKRGRLIVGLDIGSNLFSFRDPITGEITGFDVDIAGEVARDIFGTPRRSSTGSCHRPNGLRHCRNPRSTSWSRP